MSCTARLEKRCKVQKSCGKFVATCSMVVVVAVGQTSLFYCEHHSRHSHPGRSFISQFLQIGNAGFCWFGCSIWCRWWNDHQSRLLIHLSLWEALRLNSLSSSSSNNPGLFSSCAVWGGRLCSVASSTWKPDENLQHWLEGKIVHLHLLDSANCYTTTILGQKSNFGHFWTATLYILTKGTLPRQASSSHNQSSLVLVCTICKIRS